MKPVGYTYLNRFYNLLLPKLGVEVYQDPKADEEHSIYYGATKRKIIPRHRKIPDTPYDHMVAAIKYQGIRLHFFAAVFKKVDSEQLSEFIKAKPNSVYNRVVWYLFEWLTGKTLPIEDLASGNYVTLFDSEYYYTLSQGERDKRTRIINNALGTKDFCPTIRKTPEIKELEDINVYETAYSKMQSLGKGLSTDVIGRSINYLYTKETKSSTEIEKESTAPNKMNRFLKAIKNAGLFELSKEKLIDIQNQIVEAATKNNDYRMEEIYVGTTIQKFGELDEDIHYIGPLAKHVPSMMKGLLDTHDKLMIDGQVPPLMHATLISFGEVYIHPFTDGNGRTHRYLIHDVMKQRVPDLKLIIPISAAILKNQDKYDEVLELISKPLLSMLDWELDRDNGNRVIINNDIDFMYRYPDYTEHVKFTYKMMNTAISQDLVQEICLLLAFDEIKKYINSKADIPNSKLDTIVSILIQGDGQVSKAKLNFVSQFLSDSQLTLVEGFATQAISSLKEKLDADVTEIIRSSKI